MATVVERHKTGALPVNAFSVNQSLSAILLDLANSLSPIRLNKGILAQEVKEDYRGKLESIDAFGALRAKMKKDLQTVPSARGYVVIDGVFSSAAEVVGDLRLPTALCTLAGTPFRPFERWGLWLEVGVDLKADSYRFGGVGYNPFHIDVVNSTKPPAYFCFFCIRTDPAGSGETILSNLQHAVTELSEDEIEQLQKPMFREGQFYDLSGVGKELNPFPVLEMMPSGLWQVRFTGKMLPDMPDSDNRRLLRKFEQILIKNQESFLVRPGQILIVNQVLMAHGRLPLGPGQEAIPPARRRYLRQMYMHSNAECIK